MEDDVVDFFDRHSMSGAAEVTTPPDAEARYEEGVPLVQSEAQRDPPTPVSDSLAPFTGEPGSFSQLGSQHVDLNEESSPDTDGSFSRPQPLNRKTTEQVLDSLHFPHHHHHGVHDQPETFELANKVNGSGSDSASDGSKELLGIDEEKEDHTHADAVNNPGDDRLNEIKTGVEVGDDRIEDSSGEVSQVDNSVEPRHEASLKHDALYESAEQQESQVDTADDDLAEIWKVALGDDDFLGDEELLADRSFFEDGDQGFMGDDQKTLPLETRSEGQSPSQAMLRTDHYDQIKESSMYSPASTQPYGLQQTPPNPYTSEPSGYQPSPSTLPVASDLNRQSLYTAPFSMRQQQARPGLPEKTQSFADKSKGGYTSPYDLPLDISRPKKRVTQQHTNWGSTSYSSSASAPPAPPPRSSSMYTSQRSVGTQNRLHSPPRNNLTASSIHPPISLTNPQNTRNERSSHIPNANANSFFEELPISAKPRPQSALGRTVPPQTPISPPLSQTSSFGNRPPSHSPPSNVFQLQAPERINPYAVLPDHASGPLSTPRAASRYSPAPPAQSNAPQSRTRYATPPISGPPPSRVLPFQPRTSSPLAQHQRGNQQPPPNSGASPQVNGGFQDTYAQLKAGPQHTLHQPDQNDATSRGTLDSILNGDGQAKSLEQTILGSPPESDALLNRGVTNTPPPDPYSLSGLSPPKRATSAYPPPPHPSLSNKEPSFHPPRRSQTQSPGKLFSGSRLPTIPQEPYQRPASVHEPTSSANPPAALVPLPFQQSSRQRSNSQIPNFISPTDGREADPLERWKGCPVFVFGFGGAIVSSFPKRIPRYSAGLITPMLKCSPGEIQLRSIKDVTPLEDHVAKFPGPLRSKGKKKDLLTWLDDRVVELEKGLSFVSQGTSLPDPRKRFEEKILLWKVLRALVEHDGVLEGNLTVEGHTRSILSPETEGAGTNFNANQLHAAKTDLVGISRPSGSAAQSIPTNYESVESIRKLLVRGEREKAVWHAVDQRLWAHAMLISSTLSKDVWKQVAQEFVRQEVKLTGDNTESLAALYEVFAGNWEESIDELVPPSARAGLQMVSKLPGNGPTKNALDGLDRWRETLSLILSNRSVDDAQAIVCLGRLLSGYGRIEAAHVCYLFARSSILFGGSDNPQAQIALIGANLFQQPFGDATDMDAILLSEIYEYSSSMSSSSSSAMPVVPYLQGYKLYHALKLAENGYRAEAQQYCDAIANSLKMTTKLAPYYHTLLFRALDDLTKRLLQSPKDGSSSWISKPSMEKVSGSVWAKFNSFVAGDDSDAPSTGSGKDAESDVGPFAKVAGGTPTISRSPSNTDLYGSYPAAYSGQPPVAASGNSRYAPRTSLDQPGRSSYESQRASPYEPARISAYENSRNYQPHIPLNNDITAQQHSSQQWPAPQPLLPFPNTLDNAQYPPDQSPPSLKPLPSPYQQDADHPTSSSSHATPFGGYGNTEPASNVDESDNSSSFQPMPSSEQDSQAGHTYSNTYEPPSYDPGYQDNQTSPVDEKPKKRFTMDDDDDEAFTRKAADTLKNEKSRKDKEADEGIKRAAAEDGKQQTFTLIIMTHTC